MKTVTGPGLPASGVEYLYDTDGNGTAKSNLVTQVNYKSGSSTTIVQTTRAFGGRGLIESVQNDWTGSSPSPYMASKYAYVNDALARRTSCVRTGTAFAADHHDVWTYNDRNELTGSQRRLGTTVGSGTEVDELDRAYDYDPIGNRRSSTKGEDDPIYYCANELNQYDFTATAAPPCSSQPAEVFEHDEDGNLIAAPLGETPTAHTLEWDAENRLKAAYPTAPEAGSKKVEYTYDYMNRRVERIVTDWDPELGENGDWETTPVEHTRYVYHGWNVILELDALDSNAITKKYTWGLDLAGLNGAVNSLDQAGGIGGLLACLDTAGTPSTADDRTLVYCYDANGNVTQLVETTTGGNYGTIQAAYEYDAYGNTVVASGGYAPSNLIRFSTRPVDALTLLGHWLMRVNDFERGRWTGRDSVAEVGGALLYCYALNHPARGFDALGNQPAGGCCGPDITHSLQAALARFDSQFQARSAYFKADVCLGMYSSKGWDLNELFWSGSSGGFAPFERNGCGTGSCAGTVQVGGLCFRSAEVNYILWGHANRVCHDSMVSWSRPLSHPWAFHGRRAANGALFPDTQFDPDCVLIYGWRAYGAPLQRISANAIGPGNARCRCAWMLAGYTGDIARAYDCEVRGCGTTCCRRQYQGRITGYIGYPPTRLMRF